jgi:hypothetical protein
MEKPSALNEARHGIPAFVESVSLPHLSGPSFDKLWIDLVVNFFPRMAKPLAGEDVFRGLDPRKTDGGSKIAEGAKK